MPRNLHVKKNAQVVHARSRALERYGITLSSRQVDQLSGEIRNGKGTLVERQSLRVSLYDIRVGDQTCRVAYDHGRRMIVTFLKREHGT